MAEEYRAYYQCIDALKKQYKGSNKDDFIRNVFVDAFKMGRKMGFDAGYSKAINDVESFDLDESLEDKEDNLNFKKSDFVDFDANNKYDPIDEMLNC